MSSWPDTWAAMSLEAAGIPVNSDTIRIMLAWKRSTPLPPYTNNPVGMPAGYSGAAAYLGTGYAMFRGMSDFYASFARFIKSGPGGKVAVAMSSKSPYPGTWREISALAWPGSKTETDYPSALLDMTTESYQQSVNATSKAERKTSGTVQARQDESAPVLANNRLLYHASQAITDAGKLTEYLIRNGNANG